MLTSMFLHGGWLHLGLNILFLWVFGGRVVDSMDHSRSWSSTSFVESLRLCTGDHEPWIDSTDGGGKWRDFGSAWLLFPASSIGQHARSILSRICPDRGVRACPDFSRALVCRSNRERNLICTK